MRREIWFICGAVLVAASVRDGFGPKDVASIVIALGVGVCLGRDLCSEFEED